MESLLGGLHLQLSLNAVLRWSSTDLQKTAGFCIANGELYTPGIPLVELRWCRFLARAWNYDLASSCWYYSASWACTFPYSSSSCLKRLFLSCRALSSCLRMQKLWMSFLTKQPLKTFWMRVACWSKQVRHLLLMSWRRLILKLLRAQQERKWVWMVMAAAFLRRNSLRLMYILNLDWILRAAALSLAQFFSHWLALRQQISLTPDSSDSSSPVSSINQYNSSRFLFSLIRAQYSSRMLFSSGLNLPSMLLLNCPKHQSPSVAVLDLSRQMFRASTCGSILWQTLSCSWAMFFSLRRWLMVGRQVFCTSKRASLRTFSLCSDTFMVLSLPDLLQSLGCSLSQSTSSVNSLSKWLLVASGWISIIINSILYQGVDKPGHLPAQVPPQPLPQLFVILLMQGGSFLIQWTKYRKLGRLEQPQLVVGRVPASRLQFDFVLEVAAQIALISVLSPSPIPDHPTAVALAQYLTTRPATLILTRDYVGRLVQLQREFGKGGTVCQHHWNSFLLHILIQFAGLPHLSLQQEGFSYPQLLTDLFKLTGKNGIKETFKIIGDWWTLKLWTCGVNPALTNLLFLWLSTKEQLPSTNGSHLDNSSLVVNWFSQVQHFLKSTSDITDKTVASLVSEAKSMANMCQLKGKKTVKPFLLEIKNNYLKLHHQPENFAISFTVLETLANEVDSSLFNYSDLLEHQQFYSYLYYLQKIDKLHLFPSFHRYMRINSVLSVLLLNRTLSCQMCKTVPHVESIQNAIQAKKMELMSLFNTKPISLASQVLDQYLKKSGIFIKEKRWRKSNRNLPKQLKLFIPDPLEFILIKKQYWEDKFGSQILGISLWIILEAYCKEVQSKSRESDKQIAEFFKKIKIALCIFLLELKYPIKMLVFLPLQNDIASDFVMIPILPKMLLETQYFFSTFDRQNIKFSQKVDFSGEGDVFPWGQTLTSQKNIHLIIHNYKGYQFFGEVFSKMKGNSQIQYGQAILTVLTAALQGMGISPSVPEQNLRQILVQIDPQSLTEMCILLQKIAVLGEEVGECAQRWCCLLSSSDAK